MIVCVITASSSSPFLGHHHHGIISSTDFASVMTSTATINSLTVAALCNSVKWFVLNIIIRTTLGSLTFSIDE